MEVLKPLGPFEVAVLQDFCDNSVISVISPSVFKTGNELICEVLLSLNPGLRAVNIWNIELISEPYAKHYVYTVSVKFITKNNRKDVSHNSSWNEKFILTYTSIYN